jgi:hypothetical protein
MSLIAQKLISASGPKEETDSDFNLVTALYHFDTTTDNGNNSTFLDSSSESHTVTPGSTPPTQGSFSPFSAEEGKWSGSFDGTDDYLQIANSADFNLGSGDFTLEAYVFQTSDASTASNSHNIFNKWNNTSSAKSYAFRITSSSGQKLQFFWSTDGNNNNYITSNDSLTSNQWHHVAVVNNGGTITLYIDGTAQSSTGTAGTLYSASVNLNIGRTDADSGSQYFDGFISNARLVKGTAVYTSNFTPSTSPLTAVTNTKLLTCCSNRLRDKSTSAHAITAVNGASIKPFSPFNPSEAYSASVKGGSANFSQLATSKLDVTDASDFDFGTGDFTVEAWVYPTKDLLGGGAPFALMLNGKGYNFYIGWTTYSSAGLVIYGGQGVGSIYSGSTDHVPQKYAWSHIVYQNTSGNFNFYLNGTRVCNVADSGSFPDVTGVTVGVNDSYGSYYLGAHVSDLRVVKGSNVYSNASTLTVPTAPLTSVTNTKLLLNFTNSVFFDSTGKTNARFFSGSGLVRSKTGQKKFGTASAQWTGTGAYLRLNQSLEPNLIPVGGGDFTIEFQLRLTNVTSTQVIIDFRHNANSNTAPAIYISSGFKFYAGSSEITIGTISINTWHHIALVRNGSTITSYIDGTAGGTESNTNNLTTEELTIGSNWDGDYRLIGYMDELRITVGKARYTSNFTAPTEAFLDR